ncbi:phage tail spike protein [Streptococcus acidominimus]|uniref:phage tail spike protein n=1 Tax=Streptococcus acidominimus TaxID=1326 RepID=UPI001F56E872|nr:phage tail spike protein [Streptococcus acidominimus]
MLLTIHDANLRKVAFIDNSKQATLNYFNDTWTRYLETGSSTFDFTVFKKAIISDVGRKRAYNHLNEKAFVSFQYKGKTYLHTIRKVEENEQTIKCYGINLNLELINEYANPYKSPKAMTFKEFCDAMGLLSFTFLKIGANEISTKKISAEWEGSDTKLNRLLSLAKKFGAEIEFDTYLNADSSIKSFVVNVYHENDDTHQGVGRISPTILKYGRNLKTLTRTVDKTNIYNMVRPTGRTENGETVTISGLGAWYVNNAKGEREFYQEGEGLFAPLSKQMYPAAFTSNTMGDQWIRKDMQVESSNPEVIRSTAYRELKKNCYPAVTYEAEGFADLEIGDTVQVYDDGFSPTLLLNMRVSEQSISFTNPTNNKTTFSNAKALENRLSGGIQQRLDQMIEDAKPYIIRISTDNGTVFKNGQGQSVVTPTLLKGNKVINSGWRWSVNGEFRTTSSRFIAKASEFSQKMVLEVSAWIGNKEVATEQITFIDASDGENGLSSYTYYAYSAYSDGRDMTTLPVEGSAYVGQATVTNGVRPTNHTDYVWAKFKGDDGKINAEQLEEINQKIEQKADHALTQEQLNALSEKAGIIQAELEAKASIATVSQWFAEFQQFVKDNAAGKIVSEQNLLTLTQRVASIDVDLGGMAQRWSFLDHYMKAGEEGLIIGKNDGSSSVRISDNRISFYSAGQEVAYISGGVLQIDNGVFTKTLQIGRFREEQYHLNLDMNVIRYVGG